MLRLTKKVEYGLIALKHINEKTGEEICPAKEIAECANIPRELLAKILQRLTRAGMIKSIQGPKGGYVLSCSLSDVSLSKFLDTIEGGYAMVECATESVENCSLVDCCNVRSPLLRINQQMKLFLDKITLADILADVDTPEKTSVFRVSAAT
jgi:Rrf2 family protein